MQIPNVITIFIAFASMASVGPIASATLRKPAPPAAQNEVIPAADGSPEFAAWEIGAGSKTALTFTSAGSVNTTQFEFVGLAGYSFTDLIQFVVNFEVSTLSGGGTSVTAIAPSAGVRLNFGAKELGDQFFAGPRIGFLVASANSVSSTNFLAGAEIGKRFSIARWVSYTPGFSFAVVTASTAITTFSFVPLAFSIFI